MKETYTFSDFLWQTIRLILLFTLIYGGTQLKVSFLIGVPLGAVAYFILYRLFEELMNLVLNCEALSLYDSILMQDDQKNISNIVGTMFFEKFQWEEMRDYLMTRTGLVHKCRSKLVKRFGIWWF